MAKAFKGTPWPLNFTLIFAKVITMKYYIETLGCQTNQSDTERMSTVLNKLGGKKTLSINSADLIIANACSIRQSAIDRIYGIVDRKAKKNKKAIYILTGCVLEDDRKKFSEKFDIILDIRDLKKLPQIIKKFKSSRQKSSAIKNRAGLSDIERWQTAEKSIDYFNVKPSYESPFQAQVPVMTGCNNFCTYCAVPFTRGKEVSRPADKIIKEVKALIKKGYKEITLLGQNVNSYKYVIPNDGCSNCSSCASGATPCCSIVITLSDLLREINDIPGDFWIRFHASHPKDFTNELINTIAECEKVTEYINLPVQSGNDKVLKRMARPYTLNQYKNIVKKIRKKMPDASISTDFIVGFPKETKAEFNDSKKLYKELKFNMAYIAQYSPRPGTASAKNFEDNVPVAEKKRRDIELTKVLKKVAANINKKGLGKTSRVLIDGTIKRQNGSWLIGKTRYFATVKIPLTRKHSSKTIGQFVDVKIKQALDLGLVGEIV